MAPVPLSELGNRIWITGPSAGGKSTLASAIAHKLDLPVVHLDQLRFEPSSWRERPDDAFLAAVTEAVDRDAWVIDGNYFSFLANRLQRATGIISLSTPRLGNYLRYLRRCFGRNARVGTMDGAGEEPNLLMSRWILLEEPRGRSRKRRIVMESGKPVVATNSFHELKQLYAEWRLPDEP
jgi:adenylate kinase family enzyme